MLTDEQLRELEEKAKKAIKGQCHVQEKKYMDNNWQTIIGADVIHENGMHVGFFHAQANAEYYVVANPSVVLELVSMVRTLQKNGQ